jgi:hypothetical protein
VVITEPEVSLTELGLDPRLLSWGLADLDALLGVPGVPGGVTPLPLALLSPMTLTSSLTETPISSGGMSLLTMAAAAAATPEVTVDFLGTGGLWEPPLRMASPLNHF